MTSDSASAASSTSKSPTLASATTARPLGSPSARQPGGGRGGHSSSSRIPPSASCWPAWAATVRTRVAGSPRCTGVLQPAPPSSTSRGLKRADDLERHPFVVGLGVGEDERVEALHARLAEPAQDRAAGRPGVEEHRGAAVLEQRRVALADVEEGDDELAGRGAAAAAARRERRARRRATTRSAASARRRRRRRRARRAGPPAAPGGRPRERGGAAPRRRPAPARPGRRAARAAPQRAAGRRRARSTRGRRAAAR